MARRVPGTAEPQPVKVEIRNVDFRFDSRLILYIAHLRGELLPTHPGTIASFDHPRSFLISITSARVALTPASMSQLMNGYVFARKGSGFKQIQVSYKHGELREQGTIHKGVPLPAEMTGTMQPTAQGKIRLHPTSLKALHVPFGGLMHLFGLTIRNFINIGKTRGLAIRHGDLIFDPQTAFPAPHIRGRVVAVRFGRKRLWIHLSRRSIHAGKSHTAASPAAADHGRPATKRPSAASPLLRRGYMRYRGGSLHFGKMTMDPVDLTIIGRALQGPFDFFLRHYQQQLVAGYIKATPDYGWVVYMP